MLNEVFMPKLSMAMETGTIMKWFKEEGEAIRQGEVLLEVLTDKINIEVEAYHSGILLKRYYEEDAVVPVNHIIGYIGAVDDQAPDFPPDSAGAVQEDAEVAPAEREIANRLAECASDSSAASVIGKPRATPAARKAARERNIELARVKGSGEHGRIHRADVESYAAGFASSVLPVLATPLAKKIADEHNLQLNRIEGSGPRGKILRVDVENSLNASANANGRTPVQDSAASSGDTRSLKLQGMRRTIAEHMAQSAFTAPHVTITTTVDMTAAKALRAELLPVIEQQTGMRLSYTEILLKAVSLCLVEHPRINARWMGEEVVLHDQVNIGLAVSVEDGLMVPVIHQAQQLGLAELVRQSKELAAKARDNKLKSEDMAGGTFTMTNLGMYAVDSFTPIINQPEVAILGVGRIEEKPAIVNGEVKACPLMTLSLSFDHRIVDGAPAAAFLTDLKKVLERPFLLLV